MKITRQYLREIIKESLEEAQAELTSAPVSTTSISRAYGSPYPRKDPVSNIQGPQGELEEILDILLIVTDGLRSLSSEYQIETAAIEQIEKYADKLNGASKILRKKSNNLK